MVKQGYWFKESTDTELYLQVDSNMKLGEWAGLCKIDREGVYLKYF